MSDVVVIETVPAEIVEVVAAGPQGPVGDVNPQMPIILAATEAARDAALVSELSAAASQSAAATSAANAATSESNAATSAATATAQATASAGSATASAGSAAAAQSSATNAATSETNAANSATASANSATSSANSATAAQAAQTAAESARDTTLATIGTAALKANNLSDLASIPTALVNLGLNNVSNTSDANKPISTATQAALDLKENAANKGVANGYAGLDAAGLVPATQLPSYVDDVLEYANLAAFPVTGEAGKIYVALDTNKTYRWSGSAYIYITSGAVDSVAGKTGVVTLVKGDVGLGNVDNTSDANKPVSTAQQAALDLKANAASPTTTGTLTHSGDIVLSGSGKRITGDFSNTTVANRVMFQTSTTNGFSAVGVIPNGTGAFTSIEAWSGSSADENFAQLALVKNSDVSFRSSRIGTGTYLPMTFWTGGAERMRVNTTGQVGIGTNNPLGTFNVFGSGGNAILSNTAGTSNDSHTFMVGTFNGATPHWSSLTLNASTHRIQCYNTEVLNIGTTNGALVTYPIGLGYGTGAGGTVTQATSKGTTVTLNKPTGQITMNNSALAAGAKVTFAVNNSLVTVSDVPHVVVASNSVGDSARYRASCTYVGAGVFYITVENIGAVSYSDNVYINFAIIKGAVA